MNVKISNYNPNDKFLTFDKLKQLQFCNSKKLPKRIIVRGQALEWVGIGWIEVEKNGTEVRIVNDNNKNP